MCNLYYTRGMKQDIIIGKFETARFLVSFAGYGDADTFSICIYDKDIDDQVTKDYTKREGMDTVALLMESETMREEFFKWNVLW